MFFLFMVYIILIPMVYVSLINVIEKKKRKEISFIESKV